MKSPDNVLLGIALFLLAGVILYNVFTTDVETQAVEEMTTSVVTTTEVSTTTQPIVATSTKVNINTASAEELMTLSGIGPTKAQAIVDYRTNNGAFATVDDLINVSGIGEKTLAKIRDEITV